MHQLAGWKVSTALRRAMDRRCLARAAAQAGLEVSMASLWVVRTVATQQTRLWLARATACAAKLACRGGAPLPGGGGSGGARRGGDGASGGTAGSDGDMHSDERSGDTGGSGGRGGPDSM